MLRLRRVASGPLPRETQHAASLQKPEEFAIVTLEQIRQAQERIAGVARKTPLLPLGNGTPRLWLALSYLALFATLLAFGIQTWAQKILPPVRIALIGSLEPVFAALWAALLIGERLSGREFFGGALIVLGVVVGEVGSAFRALKRAV